MQLKGWIIYNGNLYTQKFSEQVEWLLRTASQFDIELEAVANHELLVTIDGGNAKLQPDRPGPAPDFVFFWDKDLFLARQLEQQGIRLFNSARAIEICDDKALTHQQLANQGIPMPKTIIAPKIYRSVQDDRHLTQVIETLGFPLIMKESFGSFGEQVYYIQNERTLRQKVHELGNTPYIFQQYVQSSYGKDVRLHVVGDRVVAAMLRKAEGDFRANVTAGGKMFPYQPTEAEKALAVRCSQLVGADFTGVDLLFGANQEPILCEINSNAHFKNIYDCTGIDLTKAMLGYIKEQL
ncbi:ATP-grasp domain-containing protein [Gracilibacillus alcaliphilus]|uniref:ATP-grasp domain-containing protein n=1 Tax=Gracilibacillus alcaliphilus TaxID=1401441 RepID=UPI00195D18CE|nr:RimK family alpha-L-glutamate ligase [Gracilibacillus alcaliphilus]MBM7678515.1 RimK family alpha-L-glutamate ligase [Gracilibacillus alcaliphilus]